MPYSVLRRAWPGTLVANVAAMSELQFKKAVYLIRNGPPAADSSNESKLSFYKFYKQATEGDVTGSQPWAVQLEARAKWDAWNSVKGASGCPPCPHGIAGHCGLPGPLRRRAAFGGALLFLRCCFASQLNPGITNQLIKRHRSG